MSSRSRGFTAATAAAGGWGDDPIGEDAFNVKGLTRGLRLLVWEGGGGVDLDDAGSGGNKIFCDKVVDVGLLKMSERGFPVIISAEE